MGLWECGQSRPQTRNPNAAQIRIVHRFPCSPRRRETKTQIYSNNADKRKCGKNVGNPCPKPETRKQRKKRIVHRLSTLSAPPRTKNSRATRKDQKTGTPSEFSIGSGRIGPGAASKMQKPARTLNNPLPPRFYPEFDDREIQLLEDFTLALLGDFTLALTTNARFRGSGAMGRPDSPHSAPADLRPNAPL